MGDRAMVAITVPVFAQPLVEALVDAEYLDPGSVARTDVGYRLFDEQANWGEAVFEQCLRRARVPYDKHWSAGDSYSGGQSHYRREASGEFKLFERPADRFAAAFAQVLEQYADQGRQAAPALLEKALREYPVVEPLMACQPTAEDRTQFEHEVQRLEETRMQLLRRGPLMRRR